MFVFLVSGMSIMGLFSSEYYQQRVEHVHEAGREEALVEGRSLSPADGAEQQQSGQQYQQRQTEAVGQPRHQRHEQYHQEHQSQTGTATETDGQRTLAHATIVVHVAQIVDQQYTHGDESAHGSGVEYLVGETARLQDISAAGSDNTVVQKDEGIRYAQIGEGIGRGRVEPGKQNSRQADGQDDPAAHPGQIETRAQADSQRE